MTITKKFSKKLNVLKTKKKSKRTKKKGMNGGHVKVGHPPPKQPHVFTTIPPSVNIPHNKPVLTTNPKFFNGTSAKNYFLGTGKEYKKGNRRIDRINTNNLIKQLQNPNHSTHRDIIIKSLSTKYDQRFVESASKNSKTFIELLKIAKQTKNSSVNPLKALINKTNSPHYSSLNREKKTSPSLNPINDVYSIPSYGPTRPIEEPTYATLN
jgi:hypothetical protein